MDKSEVRHCEKARACNGIKERFYWYLFYRRTSPFNAFLSNYMYKKPGDMRKLDGTFIKRHDGLMNYTIGQRKGFRHWWFERFRFRTMVCRWVKT